MTPEEIVFNDPGPKLYHKATVSIFELEVQVMGKVWPAVNVSPPLGEVTRIKKLGSAGGVPHVRAKFEKVPEVGGPKD